MPTQTPKARKRPKQTKKTKKYLHANPAEQERAVRQALAKLGL